MRPVRAHSAPCFALVVLAATGSGLGAQPLDGRIVVAPRVRDANFNQIDDALEIKVVTGALIGPAPELPTALAPGVILAPRPTGRKPYADLLVSLAHPPQQADFSRVTALGGQVVRAWSRLVFCMHVRLPEASVAAGAIQALAASPGVTWVEENHVAELDLFYSTQQTRARAAWARTTPIDGDSSIRIAICDTGLDGTEIGSAHADFGTRIAAWYDAYSVENSLTPYTNAIDENGHGSHVAGIVAGSGASAGISSGDGLIGRTHAAFYSSSAGGVWNVPAARMPINTTGIGTTSSIDSDTYWSTSPSPGSFVLAELWDSGFDSDPGSASLNWDYEAVGGSQPLNVPYDYLSSGIEDFRYVGSTYPYENNAGTAWYVSQNACRQVAVDNRNLNSGIAPECGLVGIRVVDEWGSGASTAAELLEGLDWISLNNETYNIVCVNMSLSYDTGPGGALDAAVNSLVAEGVVCVASAGNKRGTANIGEPGTASRAVTVAATSELDKITSYSSVGGTGSNKPDVAAPGGSVTTMRDITSVDTGDSEYIHNYAGSSDAISSADKFDDDYTGISGTSMSAPHVAGLVGLLADALGGMGSWSWTLDQALAVKSIILMTATETNQNAEAIPNPTLDREAGRDTCEGYGRINVDAAVSAVLDEMLIAPDGTASESTSFNSDPTGRKCWARYVQLKRNSEYVFRMFVPNDCDADLYLYSDTHGSNGDPVIAVYSTTGSTSGNTERLKRTIQDPGDPTTDTYYLVAKLVAGSGEMSISSIIITPAEVSNLRAELLDGRPVLLWDVAEADLLAGFTVWAASAPDGTWERCTEQPIPARNGTCSWRPPVKLLRQGLRCFSLRSSSLLGSETDYGYVVVDGPR